MSCASAAARRIQPSRLRHPLAPAFALASGCTRSTRFRPGIPGVPAVARAVGNMLQRAGRNPATPVRIRERIYKLHLEAGRSVAGHNSIFSFLLGAVCGIGAVLRGLVGASMTLMHMVPCRAGYPDTPVGAAFRHCRDDGSTGGTGINKLQQEWGNPTAPKRDVFFRYVVARTSWLASAAVGWVEPRCLWDPLAPACTLWTSWNLVRPSVAGTVTDKLQRCRWQPLTPVRKDVIQPLGFQASRLRLHRRCDVGDDCAVDAKAALFDVHPAKYRYPLAPLDAAFHLACKRCVRSLCAACHLLL